MRVAIQMDPTDSIKFATDSTLRLGLEAHARGYALWYYTPDKLTYLQGDITAECTRITFYDDPDHFYDLGETARLNLREFDVILLRQDPPFDMTYLSTTYILERLAPDVLVVNDPAGVRNNPEKLFPTLFKEFMPPTLVTADLKEISHFRKEHKDIVIKPLYGFAGHAVTRVKPRDDLAKAYKEAFGGSREPVMAQPFLPEVKTGDRRIILIDGKVGGVMARIPAEDDFRANFRVGGSPAKAELTKRQKEICAALEPELKKRGLLFAGIDVIGDYLTEVNVTSPTGIAAMNTLYGFKLQEKIWDAIEARL